MVQQNFHLEWEPLIGFEGILMVRICPHTQIMDYLNFVWMNHSHFSPFTTYSLNPTNIKKEKKRRKEQKKKKSKCKDKIVAAHILLKSW